MSKVFCFDLDNTLYLPEKNILTAIDGNIQKFLYENYGYQHDEIFNVRKEYHEKYGSTLLGLIMEKGMDPTYYLEYIHQIDDCLLPGKDEKLRKILLSVEGKIIMITNSSKKYAVRVLVSLGVADIFDSIFDVVDMEYMYKCYPESYIKILKKIGIKPQECIMFDDLWEDLRSAKSLGMTTVLVNQSYCEGEPHYHIKNIYDLPQIIKCKL